MQSHQVSDFMVIEAYKDLDLWFGLLHGILDSSSSSLETSAKVRFGSLGKAVVCLGMCLRSSGWLACMGW